MTHYETQIDVKKLIFRYESAKMMFRISIVEFNVKSELQLVLKKVVFVRITESTKLYGFSLK